MTTSTTPAEERYTGHDLERIRLCEFETDPLTPGELDGIDAYHQKVNAVPDCLDCPDAMPEEWGIADVIGYFRSMYEMLADWRESIRELIDHLRGDGDWVAADGLTTAANRFVGWELCAWAGARERLHAALVSHWLSQARDLGKPYYAPEPDGFRYVDGIFWIPAL